MEYSIIESLYFLILVISSAQIISLADSLSGEHVCTRIENVTLSRRETYKEPIVVNTFTWCLKVPPRCPKTRIEMRGRYRIKTTIEQRIVTECCEGYISQDFNDDIKALKKCVPFCKTSCKNGVCIAPNVCLCKPGFGGSNCSYVQNTESETVDGILENDWTNKSDLFTTVQVSNLVETTETNDDYLTESWTEDFGSRNTIMNISKTLEKVENESTTVFEQSEGTDIVTSKGNPTTKSSFDHELTPFEKLLEMVTERNSADEITEKELDYRNYVNEESKDSVSTESPLQRSYVKTVQKGNDSQIPKDMTVFIIVGCIGSLCLTTLAVLMIFYLRCNIFDTIPISIYSTEKNDRIEDRGEDNVKNLKITNTTLPPLPTFVNPVFTGSQEAALITFDAAELNKHYDSRTATISIRVSGNIRDLLESHYDRPPTAATCRHTIDQNTEHVYDEIPLTVPLCVRKES